MKKQTYLILLCCLCLVTSGLVACGGKRMVKPAPKPPTSASKPASTSPPVEASSTGKSESTGKPGAYYLDDGPGTNPPHDIDSIPNALPKKEPLLDRSNKPYKALGELYTPMTRYQPYKAGGVASWYGKRYHGRKTSSGEVYDMYGMTAAHPTLPLPSYVKVTNPANGRYVVVRVNDRGPFKHNRIIDLSYAAAYKLRFTAQGSALVEVEAIDASAVISQPILAPVAATPMPVTASKPNSSNASAIVQTQYFIQAGAFKNEINANALMNKIQGLDIEQNAGFNNEYNNGLYRLKLGPYTTKQQADQVAATIRAKLNTSAIVINQ